MTTTLEEIQTEYRISENLLVSPPSMAVQYTAPDEAEREDMVLKKLGAKAWGRLHQFRYYYGPKWGEGSGKPLSPRALELFYRFVAELRLAPVLTKPSLFLTDSGNLELCWEDNQGKAVQMEFTPNGVEYLVESERLEGRAGNGDLPEIARKLSQV